MNTLKKERRTHDRVPLEIWVDETHQDTTYFLHTTNVSMGGMFLGGTLPHAPGTVIHLQFTLPGDDQPIKTRGEVVANDSIEAIGMRVRFLDLDKNAAMRGRLARFLDHVTT